MAEPTSTPLLSLDVTRTFNASPQEVFDAWTKAEGLSRWFAPAPDLITVVHELDVRPGGRYRIEMKKDAARYVVAGVYERVTPPHDLAFTWQWETGVAGAEESLVEITLSPIAHGTELLLRHTRLGSEESRAGHAQGWDGCLNRLPAALTLNR